MIKVAAALIENNGKILIARRLTGNASVINKWEFPGGKVESGETEKEAIEREIREEFELVIKANNFITNVEFTYPDKVIDLRLYACEYIEGTFKLHVHSEYKWIKAEELLDYDLAPADIPLAEYVKINIA